MAHPRGAADIIGEQVRELLKDRGIDPFREPIIVRQLIDETISSYVEESLSGTLPLIPDSAGLSEELFDALAGLGPLQRFMDDPTVEEIWINGPGRVFIARHGRSELTTVVMSSSHISDTVEKMLKHTGRRVDLSTPFVDAHLPDGSRLHVAIPDITREHWAVNIRKFVSRATTLHQLVTLGTLSTAAMRFLEASVICGLNIVVAGGTQAGKTTLLGCLANCAPAAERIVTCEEVFELKIDRPDWVAMQTRQANLEGQGEIGLRRLITEALRMRPSRIVVGEVRQAECLDMLIALNAGLPGMCSIHANSAREAVTKMCTLPLLAGANISSSFVLPTVANAIDLVVHIGMTAEGDRRVTEIIGLEGHIESTTIQTSYIFRTHEGQLIPGGDFPPRKERYERMGYEIKTLLRSPVLQSQGAF